MIFTQILEKLDNLDVVVTFKKLGDEFTVSVLPKPRTSDESSKLIVPFIVTGTNIPSIIDEISKALESQLTQISEVTTNMNAFIDSAEKMKAESKMEEEKKKKQKSLDEKVKKKLENFDKLIDEKSFKEAQKLIDSAFKIDAESSLAKSCKQKLDDNNKSVGLFQEQAYTAPAQPRVDEPKPLSPDQIEAMMEDRYRKLNFNG
jgi:PRTRC genetic system protein E